MEFLQSMDSLQAMGSMDMPLSETFNWTNNDFADFADYGFPDYAEVYPHGNYGKMSYIEALYTFFIWETWVSIRLMVSKELLYPTFLYAVSVVCIAVALNIGERYRAAWVAASVAIGAVILEYISSNDDLLYTVKDTLCRLIIIHNMGAVVMILWEKFCLTEEQKRLSWGRRAIATYKIMWNSRFVKTSRPAPVFHLLKAEEDKARLRAAAAAAADEEEEEPEEPEELDESAAPSGHTDGSCGSGFLGIRKARDGAREVGRLAWSCASTPVARLWGWAGPRNRWMMQTAATVVTVWVLDRANDHVSQVVIGFDWNDVEPEKANFFRRLDGVTAHELAIRSFFAFNSLWGPYAFYTQLHSSMALFFVALGIDEPDEWPPVFGDIRQAWSLRRLWSKFWDRLIYRPVNGLGEMFMTAVGLGQRPFRGRKRWLLNGLVFAISGIFHAATDYLSGVKCSWMWELWWWNMNFVGIVGETALLYLIQAHFPRFYERMSGKAGKAIGFFWVFAWLFWSCPKNQFRAMACMPEYR